MKQVLYAATFVAAITPAFAGSTWQETADQIMMESAAEANAAKLQQRAIDAAAIQQGIADMHAADRALDDRLQAIRNAAEIRDAISNLQR